MSSKTQQPDETTRQGWRASWGMHALNRCAAPTSPATEAKHWLRAQLDAGPVDRKAVLARAKVAGFAVRTVERAAARLNVRKERSGQGENHCSRWALSTPADGGGSQPNGATAQERARLEPLRCVFTNLVQRAKGERVELSDGDRSLALGVLANSKLPDAIRHRALHALTNGAPCGEVLAVLAELSA